MIPHFETMLTIDQKSTEGEIALSIKPVITAKSPETRLMSNVLNYWRWCAEGQKAYYTASMNRDAPSQYFHDTYHNSIHYEPATDSYRFNIQTDDSVEGDTWWEGTFKLENSREGLRVTILSQKSTYNR